MAFEDIANSVMHEAKNQGRQAAENDTRRLRTVTKPSSNTLRKTGSISTLAISFAVNRGSPSLAPSRSVTSLHRS